MEAGKVHYAICILYPDKGSGVSGVVKFYQEEGQNVFIRADLKGLKTGFHGFHIH